MKIELDNLFKLFCSLGIHNLKCATTNFYWRIFWWSHRFTSAPPIIHFSQLLSHRSIMSIHSRTLTNKLNGGNWNDRIKEEMRIKIILILPLFSLSLSISFSLAIVCAENRTMEADVLNALKSQAAYLSGVRERPLIVVNVPNGELKTTWKRQPLDLCLKYLVNSLRYVDILWSFMVHIPSSLLFTFQVNIIFHADFRFYEFIIFLSLSSLLSHSSNSYIFVPCRVARPSKCHHDHLAYSKETVNNGLNVVIDTQTCSWRCARNAIQYVSEALTCNSIKLYAVRADVFWDKQRVENCTKAQTYLDVSDDRVLTFQFAQRMRKRNN